ncbi:MAG: hypothetical protein R6W83_11790, partial [Cryobacterium sp.]
DTDRFVQSVSPLIDDAAFQAYLVDEVVTAVDQQVDFDTIAADLFTGIAELELPPRAQAALTLLQQPAAEGMRSLVRSTTERVIASDAFAQVWDQTLRVSHTQITAALSGDESGALAISDTGELGIQLGPVIEGVKAQLVAQGFGLAENIPAVDRVIPIAQSDALVQAQAAYVLLDLLGFVLPWLSLLLITAGVLLARGKAKALIGAGLALAAVMALLGVALTIGRSLFVAEVSPEPLSRGAALALYNTIAPFINASALSVGLVGFTVAIVAYLAGPFRGARALRRVTVDTSARVRASAQESGADTGGFGLWLHRARRYLRIGVAVLAALIVLFVRPLTPAVIIWTAVLALVVILLIELLQRPAAEAEAVDALEPPPDTPAETPAESAPPPVGAEAVDADAADAAEPAAVITDAAAPASPGRSDTD